MVRPRTLAAVLLLSLFGALAPGVATLAQQPVIVRLGLLAAADSPAGRGAQLAIAEINGSGGITGPDGTLYAFELLSVPVSTADEVRAALDALIEREVLAFLGPDRDAVVLATFNDLQSLNLPVLMAATGDTLTIADLDDVLFRTRAPEQVYVQAGARYLARELARPVVVIVQGDSTGTTSESIVSFTAALGNQGITPLSTLQVGDPPSLEGALATLVNLNPDVVALWGPPALAADLLQGLRERGWEGVLFYRHAGETAFREVLSARGNMGLANRVLSVTNWVPGVRSAASDVFLRTYVTTFGAVPDGLSAAYYDGVYLLATAISEAGAAPGAVRQALLAIEAQPGVQGLLAPARFMIGETTNAAVVVELNPYAVPQVRSRFLDGQLVPNEGEGPVELGTPQPTPPVVTETPTPTATPEGVYGIVDTFRLNVRTGPSTNYDVLGQLAAGDVVFPVGANRDFSWLVIPFRGTTGWVAAYLLELQGDLNQLPIIQPPPSPTPVATDTPTPVPFADLVAVSAVLEPAMPRSGQPFNVRTTIQNVGNLPSVETALAATFVPGDVYVSTPIPPLAPGQATTVVLTPTVNATGTYQVELVVDLNNLVNEGPAGEANNLYPVTYTLDHAILATGSAALSPPGQEHDLTGTGTPDLRWDGSTLFAINGATVAVLPGLDWNALNYGQLVGITGASVPRVSLTVGTIVGVITAPEGYRGAVRIDGYEGDTLRYTYRVYSP